MITASTVDEQRRAIYNTLNLKIISAASAMGCWTTVFLFLTTIVLALTVARRQEIIVIGGGIAGLAAARTIRNNHTGDFHVTVFEARRNRYGGRIWSNRGKMPMSIGIETDLGAAALNSEAVNNPLINLTEKFELKTEKITPLHFFHHKLGKWTSGPQLAEAFVEARKLLLDAVSKIQPLTFDRSVNEVISDVIASMNEDELVRHILESMTTYNIPDYSAALYQVDALDFGYDTLLMDGMSELIDRLVSGGDGEVELMVDLRKVVRQVKVDEANKVVTVRLKDKTQTTVDAVIIAVPASVLQNEDLMFEPPLPHKYRDALKQLGATKNNKLIVEFDKAFWPEDVGVFKAKTDHSEWSVHVWINMWKLVQRPVLVTSIVGVHSEEKLKAMIHERLVAMFGAVAETAQIVNMFASDWENAHHSKMASSYAKVGTDPSIWEELSKPLCPYIYFAGEHTIYKGLGSLHGAYNSGVRAAEQLMHRLCDERQKTKQKAKKGKKKSDTNKTNKSKETSNKDEL